MKLYTKEMFLIAAEKCEVSMIDAEHIMKYIDEYVTPIELPSGIVNIEIQHQYHSSKQFYVDAGFVDCTKEQYEIIKQEIPTCPLNKVVKFTPIELPTDEEILKESDDYELNSRVSLGMHISFEAGAKWMRDKIQGGNI